MATPLSPIRLNHAVLFVADVERSVDSRRPFGMETVQEMPGRRRLPAAAPFGNHHDLGLFGVGPAGGPVVPAALVSTTWRGRSTPSTNSRPHATFCWNWVRHRWSSHGATKSLYGADPDGNEFEVMWMLPRGVGGLRNTAPTERLDLAAELERYQACQNRRADRVNVARRRRTT